MSSTKILNAINYLVAVLREWGENVHYLHLHVAHNGGVDADIDIENGDEVRSVFESPIGEFEHWQRQIVDTLAGKIVDDIKAKSRAYRHDQWVTMGSNTAAVVKNPQAKDEFTLSATAGEMFQLMVSALHDLETELSVGIFRHVLRMIAARFDVFVIDGMLMNTRFSAGGAAQFQFDMTRNLFPLFGQYLARPHLLFKRWVEMWLLCERIWVDNLGFDSQHPRRVHSADIANRQCAAAAARNAATARLRLGRGANGAGRLRRCDADRPIGGGHSVSSNGHVRSVANDAIGSAINTVVAFDREKSKNTIPREITNKRSHRYQYISVTLLFRRLRCRRFRHLFHIVRLTAGRRIPIQCGAQLLLMRLQLLHHQLAARLLQHADKLRSDNVQRRQRRIVLQLGAAHQPILADAGQQHHLRNALRDAQQLRQLLLRREHDAVLRVEQRQHRREFRRLQCLAQNRAAVRFQVHVLLEQLHIGLEHVLAGDRVDVKDGDQFRLVEPVGHLARDDALVRVLDGGQRGGGGGLVLGQRPGFLAFGALLDDGGLLVDGLRDGIEEGAIVVRRARLLDVDFAAEPFELQQRRRRLQNGWRWGGENVCG